MVSSAVSGRVRKRPEERREEILATAADIALTEGLERITLRAVADRLGVRPGLITHYFPAAEDLVVAAFTRAAAAERAELFPRVGAPTARLAHLVAGFESLDSWDLARLWMNARHLSRFSPALDDAVVAQEKLNEAGLVEIIEQGIAAGEFAEVDPLGACTRILMAVDGRGAYVNNTHEARLDAGEHFVADVAEWTLGLRPGTLRTDATTTASSEQHPSRP
ncbi:TetR/AcrR family transcriptional regulator [Microbacterium sp. C23T]